MMCHGYMPIVLFIFVLPILACGGSADAIGIDVQVSPDNVRIEGLPQFVCPTSTPIPTDTPSPTQIQPTVHQPPSGYVTHTPAPGCIWNGTVCASNTPIAGGVYKYPGYTKPGKTSTPRPTTTPYPTPTPYTSTYVYYFGESVFTDTTSNALSLRLAIGDIRIYPSPHYPDRQIVLANVQVTNQSDTLYLLMAGTQIFVAQIGSESGMWIANEQAGIEAGLSIPDEAITIATIQAGQTVRFDLPFYTPIGEVDAIGWILDPYANGFDGQLAGGNIAYWRNQEREGCVGQIEGLFTPPPNLTPNPTVTHTATVSACVDTACVTVMP